MWNDILDLHDFYRTGPGLVARRLIRRRLRAMWPDVTGMNMMGFGYATPFLGAFHGEAQRTIALMPPEQGVWPWPESGANLVALAAEDHLPLPDLSMDRVLLVHAVEQSEMLRPFLREIWRVLADGGRLIVVTPSRRGIWARLERTPFGHGRPFSQRQINRLLKDTMFAPERTENALFIPPFRSRMLLASASAWERIGYRWAPVFAGVLLTEARKQVYAATPLPVGRAVRRLGTVRTSARAPARAARKRNP